MPLPFIPPPEPDYALADTLISQLKKAHWSDAPATRGMHAYGYTNAEQQAIDIVVREAMGQGMEAFSDLAGNMYLVMRGKNHGAKTDIIVSHLDTVEKGGAHDGRDGVVAGIAVAAGFNRAGRLPENDLCVMIARSEESCINGAVSIGARLAAGTMKPAELAGLTNRKTGRPVLTHMAELGIPAATLEGRLDARPTLFPTGQDAKNLIGFLAEAHIEQGNYTGKDHLDIGIVSAIRGNTRFLNCAIEPAPDRPGGNPVAAYVQLMEAAEAWFQDKRQTHDVVFTPAVLSTAAGDAPPSPAAPGLNEGMLLSASIAGEAAHSGATFESDRADAVRAFVKFCAEAQRWAAEQNRGGAQIAVTPVKAGTINQSPTTVADNCTVALDVRAKNRALLDAFQKHMEAHAKALEQASPALPASSGRKLQVAVARAPGAAHCPAGALTCSFEIRSAEKPLLEEFAAFMRDTAQKLQGAGGARIRLSIPRLSDPATMNEEVMGHAGWVAQKLGIRAGNVISGAGHDTVQFSNTGTPSVMLFIRQRNALSHNPDEARERRSFRQACHILSGMVANPLPVSDMQASKAAGGGKSFTDYLLRQGAKPYAPGQWQ